jgi:hypothetical protein
MRCGRGICRRMPLTLRLTALATFHLESSTRRTLTRQEMAYRVARWQIEGFIMPDPTAKAAHVFVLSGEKCNSLISGELHNQCQDGGQ